MTDPQRPGLTPLGGLFSLLMVLGLVGLGAWLMFRPASAPPASTPVSITTPTGTAPAANAAAIEGLIPAESAPPRLPPPGTFQAKDGVLILDISEYAGYAGLIVANGGLEPNPDSEFGRLGLKVKLVKSEGDNWGKLNEGQFMASATTVDVLAVLGRQYAVTVPLLLAFSRGADGIVVRSDIRNVNDLKGKVLVATQFNEADFFLRYLTQEAGLEVVTMDAPGDPGEAVGVVYAGDAEQSCAVFAAALAAGDTRLAGCVGWAPFTDEVVAASGGKARMLVSNRNLLIVADILTVNGGFAQAQPDQVAKLVEGALWGNAQMRADATPHLALLSKTFGWTPEQARNELSKVHFANQPENQAFFAGTIASAGSYSGIFQSAVLAYGSMIRNAADSARFMDGKPLEAAAKTGRFAAEQIAIAPIRHSTQAVEDIPTLSKDLRFLFQANSDQLDMTRPENLAFLDAVKSFLQVSPGSRIILRGHVDPARKEEFRKDGPEVMRKVTLEAMDLSLRRATSVKNELINRMKLDPKRLEAVGRGWEEPLKTTDQAKNRRVEVQWFTLE